MVDDNLLETDRKRYADDVTMQELVRLRVENDKQRDAIERLREALKELLNVIPNFPPEGNFLVGMEERYNKALIEARSALQQKESE